MILDVRLGGNQFAERESETKMDEIEPKDLSKAEWKVMKIVWQERKALAREVYSVAGEEFGWTPATVKTLLRRLVDKGYLSATPVGNGFVYRPVQSAIKSLQSAADTLLTNAIDGTTGPLLAHMVQNSKLTSDDLDQLQKLIDAKKAKLKTQSSKKSNASNKSRQDSCSED